MIDNKLFSTANGRRFRIQATSRTSDKIVVLKENLTERDCKAYEPSAFDKKLYKYFRIAFNESKLK